MEGPAVIRRLPDEDEVDGRVTGVRYPELPMVDVLAGADWMDVTLEVLVVEV